MELLLEIKPVPANQVAGAQRLVAETASILASATAYAVVAAALRVKLTHWPGAGWHQVLGAIRLSVVDVLLMTLLALVACVVTQVQRSSRVLQLSVRCGFVLAGVALTIFSCVNLQALTLIGGPLTYQWVSFADGFRSETAREALRAAVDEEFAWMLAEALLAYFTFFGIFVVTIHRLNCGRFSAWILPSIASATTLFLLLSADRMALPAEERIYTANPVVDFVASAFSGGASDLLRNPDAIAPKHLPPANNSIRNLPADVAAAPIENVVVVVLESVGAKYLENNSPSGAPGLTQNLFRYAPMSLNFTNVYAHAPRSSKSLFSLLLGRVPIFVYWPDTRVFRDAQLVSLPEILRARRYRTAIFMDDLQYDGAYGFLKGRGLDVLTERRQLSCDGPVDDHCIASSTIRWIDEGRSPFFAVLWTHNTHAPYTPNSPPQPGQFSEQPNQNRYIAALRDTDAAIGTLLDSLMRRGLMSHTLVVVVGDHGEAFGEHGYNYHSNSLFEEEVHVPMLLISRRFTGRRIETLAGLSDLPQTILHILKLNAEQSWDGRSVFDPVREERVFMFAPQGPAVGFREGRSKYIYDVARAKTFAFDLATDPLETSNRANDRTPGYVKDLVAGFMKHQRRSLPARAR